MPAPTTSADFDRAYRAPVTFWGDVRIPDEVRALVHKGAKQRSLELGCGLGRFSRYLAQQGVDATAVDFSPVAIEKARARVAHDALKPDYLVGDVTSLDEIRGPFDFSFDVGCFHCLDHQGQHAYASEVSRLLAPRATHLIWALDSTPSGEELSADRVKEIFATRLELTSARANRRRLVASHWFTLVRTAT